MIMITIEQAYALLQSTVRTLPSEQVALADLAGRVILNDAVADVDSPPHDKSMMDGFAVRSCDCGPGVSFDVVETVFAGASPTVPLEKHQATRIMTGAPLPKNADAVIMIELAELSSDDSGKESVKFQIDSVDPEHHLLRRGTNFRKGEILFSAGTLIRAHDIGLLAEMGIGSTEATRLPTISILPTGDELVEANQTPDDAQIRNSNGPMLAALSRSMGLPTVELPIGRDHKDELRDLIERGLESDVLILSGGVSEGAKDLVPSLLESLNVKEIFHKVLVKPGKPIWFGQSENEKRTIVFGLPGNPVSSLVGFQLFVRPAIRGLLGGTIEHPSMLVGRLAIDHQTRGNRPTYWPAKMEPANSSTDELTEFTITPLPWNGSSDLRSLGLADGFIYFPANTLDHQAGERVRFMPF